MSLRTKEILLVLTFCLLCCFAATNQPPHRRQKRGLVKMMMHVMWDPVRLIRYWYAYDVTKEIAKSWRKIIPTMVLHPYLAGTPGLAKYMNPTYGLSTSKKQAGQFVYPEEGSNLEGYSDDQIGNDYIQSLVEQSEPSKTIFKMPARQVVFEPASSMDSQSGYNLGNEYSGNPGHFYGSTFTDGHGEEPKDHVYLQPAHHEFERIKDRPPTRQSDKNAFHSGSKPFRYNVGIPNGAGEQHVVLKAVPVPAAFLSAAEVADGHDYTASSSSNIDTSRTKNIHFGAQPSFVRIRPDTKSHVTFPASQDHHPRSGHQEIHIVLHPIPVDDPSQHSLGEPGQPVHYVPYNFNPQTAESHFAIPTAPHKSESHEERTPPPTEPQTKADQISVSFSVRNESSDKNNESSSEVYDAKQTSRVTWILKQDTRRKDAKAVDIDAKDSVSDHTSQHPLRLNGHKINMEQLREDLKHGTPVLIPFDKKVKLSPNSEKSRERWHPVDHLNIRGEIQYDSPNLSKEPMKVDEPRTVVETGISSENNSERNSTQRLLLFLARKPSSQYLS